ncbi:MAG: hypothetical protein PF569_10135 [Candidatus Woesearchaeota archaeon]|jgi:hypothetical protein|nr:hypothetical protein [Candidatus Woesearchaeota archaeon]
MGLGKGLIGAAGSLVSNSYRLGKKLPLVGTVLKLPETIFNAACLTYAAGTLLTPNISDYSKMNNITEGIYKATIESPFYLAEFFNNVGDIGKYSLSKGLEGSDKMKQIFDIKEYNGPLESLFNNFGDNITQGERVESLLYFLAAYTFVQSSPKLLKLGYKAGRKITGKTLTKSSKKSNKGNLENKVQAASSNAPTSTSEVDDVLKNLKRYKSN